MSKRKLTSEEAVANILRFVEADGDNNDFESDCEDGLGLAGDDLDEIYDRNGADEDRGDDDENEVLLTMASLSLNLNRAIDRHEKC